MGFVRSSAIVSLLALGIGFSIAPSFAQSPYPDRPIHIIVPFPAGGPADVMARLVSERMAGISARAWWSITGRAPIR